MIAAGPRALAKLFNGRRQLLVQHFMLRPGWEEGCKSCSFMADHMGGMQVPQDGQRVIRWQNPDTMPPSFL